MNRYATPSGPEGEYEPGSRGKVPRNLMRIRHVGDMNRAEARALNQAQGRWFLDGLVTDETRFTSDLIKAMHKDWLDGIYEWAGRYRTVEMSKGGFAFPPAYLVEANMGRLEAGVLTELTPCRPTSVSDVCRAVAVVHAELLLIHPFRDGNGRIARWLAHMMLAQAGMPVPRYGFAGRGSRSQHRNYIAAVMKGYAGDCSDLGAFLEDAVRRRMRFGLSSESE